MHTKLFIALATSTVASLVAMPVASADGGPKTSQHGPRVVSSGDAFAGCSTAGADDTNYPAAEVGPSLAVGPNHELVGVWQQDRWSGPGAQGITGASSTDGKHFATGPLPLSKCAPGGLDFQRASNPWVSIGPDGTVYVAATGLSLGATGVTSAVNAVASDDHGRTWRNPTTLQVDRDSTRFFNEKESVTADPIHPGVAYVVWNRADCPESCDGPDIPPHTFNPGWMSRTTDGGRTWSAPQIIAETPNHADAKGHVIVVDTHSGRLTNFFNYFTVDDAGNYQDYEAVVHSDDMGLTWSPRTIIAKTLDVFPTDPNTNADVRGGNPAAPTAGINPKTGTLYVAWTDGTTTKGKTGVVVFSQSNDHGATFSKPQRVSPPTMVPTFTPSLAVADDGTVAISYLDFRMLLPGNKKTLPTTVWLATMRPGEHGFLHERAITQRPFDLMQAPNADGFFVGDYQGLVADEGGFTSMYATVNDRSPANRTDIVVRSLEWGRDGGSDKNNDD